MEDRLRVTGELLEEIRKAVREELSGALGGRAGASGGPAATVSPRILAGDLRYFRLPEILHMVSVQSLTGRLSMSHGGKFVDIYVRDGAVAYASGEARGEKEQMGALLVGMGRLASGALDAALRKCAETGDRLGSVLVDEGYVPSADIKAALEKQTERSVYRAMAWGDGEFSFEICPMPGFVEDVQLDIKAEALIMEGVRRVNEIRLFTEKIPSLDTVFVKPAYTAEEVEAMALKEEERLVLELVDGSRDVAGMIRASGLGEFGLMKALYALYTTGIVKKASSPARKSERTQYL